MSTETSDSAASHPSLATIALPPGDQPTNPAVAPVEQGRQVPATRPILLAALGVLIIVSISLRFWTRSDLWLDEALTVSIARLPLSSLRQALRHDGSPPLYYLLLHAWILAFGTGDTAVRALSGLLSVVSLPLMWLAGRRVGGATTAWTAAVLLASSPFAIHYATETRMYSLVTLLTLTGFFSLDRVLRRGSLPAAAGLAATTAALVLTHYWSFYLLAAVGGWLIYRAFRGPSKREARIAIAAMVVGGLGLTPLLGDLFFQLAHTGTPWAEPATFAAVVDAVSEFAGGANTHGRALGLLFFGFVGLGLFGQAVNKRHIDVDLATRPRGRPLAIASLATLTIAVAVGLVTRSAFAARYTAVALVPFLLLVALGVATILDARIRIALLVAMTALGIEGASYNVTRNRTEAGRVASVLRARAQPGDIVTYCPDQLGPAVARLTEGRGLVQVTFPAMERPDLVDWVDYQARNDRSSPHQFATDVLTRAGGHAVWLVWAAGYRTFGAKCETLNAEFVAARRNTSTVVENKPGTFFEHETLWRYLPG